MNRIETEEEKLSVFKGLIEIVSDLEGEDLNDE